MIIPWTQKFRHSFSDDFDREKAGLDISKLEENSENVDQAISFRDIIMILQREVRNAEGSDSRAKVKRQRRPATVGAGVGGGGVEGDVGRSRFRG